MPEKLTGQNPENIARLTDRLSQTLASLPVGANYRTDEMIQQDGIFLMERLAQQKRGFLGLGRKRVDAENPDHLWVATQILYPEKEALKRYFITASALIKVLGENVEGKTAEDIHNRLIRDEELLNEINSSQIIHGDYPVLDILDDLIKEQPAKEEAVRQLITEAVHKGGKQADNIGVAVINVEDLVKGKIKAQTETTPTEAAQEEPATPDAKYARVAQERNLEPVGGYWMNVDGLNYKTFYGDTARIPDKYDPSEVERRVGRVGKYNGNDGKITVVGADGSMYIGLITKENISALEAANYQKDASLPTEFSEGDYPTDPEVRRLYLDFIEGKKVADTE